MTEMITQYQLIPDGIWAKGEEALYNKSYDQFCITLNYQGNGRWKVVQGLTGNGPNELSRAGKWNFHVPKFKRRQYRFDSFEDALEAGRKALPEIRRLDRTWEEEEAFFAASRAEKNGTS